MASLTGPTPWLNNANPMQALQFGADLGLRARGQDLASQEAQQRLDLAYNEMAQQGALAQAAQQSRREQVTAAMLLRAQQANALNAYREQSLAQHAEGLAQRERAADALDQYRQKYYAMRELAMTPKQGGWLTDASGNMVKDASGNPIWKTGQERLQYAPREPLGATPMQTIWGDQGESRIPMTPEEVQAVRDKLKGTKTAADALKTGTDSGGLLGWLMGAGGTSPPAITAAPSAPSLPASPFKEGQYVRNKTDNRIYRIVNGLPVLDQDMNQTTNAPAAALLSPPHDEE